MFDFSFSEIALIGVVALVVIGPERLPRVARTAGVVLGRVQRYAATVRADIAREVELSELRRVQTDIQDAARALEHGVRESLASAEQHVEATRQSLMSGPQPAVADTVVSVDAGAAAEEARTSDPAPIALSEHRSAPNPVSEIATPSLAEPTLDPDHAVAHGQPGSLPVTTAPAPATVPAQAGLFAAHETPPGPSA